MIHSLLSRFVDCVIGFFKTLIDSRNSRLFFLELDCFQSLIFIDSLRFINSLIAYLNFMVKFEFCFFILFSDVILCFLMARDVAL